MTETEKKPRKPRQPKQVPRLVEPTESSGVNLIYPSSLIVGDSTDILIKSNDELTITPHDDTIIALVPDHNKTNLKEASVASTEDSKSTYKMDTLTQIYVGSLTVVGLYVVYRLINKTR
jgi:hypothetical protein